MERSIQLKTQLMQLLKESPKKIQAELPGFEPCACTLSRYRSGAWLCTIEPVAIYPGNMKMIRSIHQFKKYQIIINIPCSMKILRVLILANFADWPRSAKISSRRKKTPQNNTPQKLTPFSQIKNSTFNGLVVYVVGIGFCFVLLLFSLFVQ